MFITRINQFLVCFAVMLSFNVMAQLSAQAGAQSATPLPGADAMALRSTISASDVQKLREIAAFQKQLDNNNPKALEKLQEETEQAVLNEIKTLHISCQVSEAKLVGKTGDRNKKLASSLYEVSCTNGMGYLMLTSPKEKTFVASCFEAEAIKKANAEAVDESPFYCQLATQTDLKIPAQKIVVGNGVGDCELANVQWYGRSAERREEYTEVSCKNSKGYLIVSGSENSATELKLIDCVTAAKQGLACKLTATKVISLLDIADGLKQHGLSCDPEKIKVFGREKVRKRQVVEALCTGQSASLIVFLPMEEGAGSYETMSCEDGAKAGIKCSSIH